MSDFDSNALVRVAILARGLAPFIDHGRLTRRDKFSEAEWARLRKLARVVDSATILRFWLLRSLVMFVISLTGILGFVFVAVKLRWFQAEWSDPWLGLLFACFIGLLLGVDLVIANRIAIACTNTKAVRARLTVEPGDAELVDKFRRFAFWVTWSVLGATLLLLVVVFLVPPYIPANPIFSALDDMLGWLSPLLVLATVGFMTYRLVRWPPAEPPR